MANVIAQLDRPVLVLTHNKTLTAQLYGEFCEFFPGQCGRVFCEPLPTITSRRRTSLSPTRILKRTEHQRGGGQVALASDFFLLSGRRNIINVASASRIYGMGNPEDYKGGSSVSRRRQVSRNVFLYKLVESLFTPGPRLNSNGRPSNARRCCSVDINCLGTDYHRVTFFGDEIESIEMIELESGKRIENLKNAAIFPANLYIAPKERMGEIIRDIEEEMWAQTKYFQKEQRHLEAKRIKERTEFDLEMIRELGYCSGVENYSRFFDGRNPGTRPFCLLDYFPDDYIMMIDESHVTIPQVRGMWGGDRARKLNLVNWGFRLPSAMDNRPLNFNEFESLINQVVYVSATPSDYELEQTGGVIVEQIIRPTGLLDPPIEVRPSLNQIDDLLEEIDERISRNERVLVTTLTKRMSEELAKYFEKLDIKVRYIHSEVETLERVEILRDLRLGEFDVLIGVNLLREGLDLPEVSLVAILDADKEGFLRNDRSLTQTAGRAARNVNGLVIFYADKMTDSMQRTIDETNRRRSIQMAYNDEHGIVPQTLAKSREEILSRQSVLDIRGKKQYYVEPEVLSIAADPIVAYMSRDQIERMVKETEDNMKKAAKDLDFITAAQLRDELFALKEKLKTV
ncbi:MAG: excinuclease ABC subunit UvrB [Saprospiraceae bacterium]